MPSIDLATFAGSLFRRYEIKIEPILRYILAQIQRDNIQDLVVFRELLAGMTDVRAIDPLLLSDDQVRLLAGSTLLRTEVTSTLVEDALMPKSDRKALGRSLKRWHNQMASTAYCQQLIVRIALTRQQCVEHMQYPESSQVRTMASIYDQVRARGNCFEEGVWHRTFAQTHLVLFQLLEYLELNHLDTYSERVPSIEDLFDRYELEPAIAFHVARPLLRKELEGLPTTADWDKRDADARRVHWLVD
jgi:THO complex subunit 2